MDEDAESRHRLRETPGFVTALTYICSQCIEDYEFDSKALENCVCILRNLSFALQEIRDPAYLIRREVAYSTATTTPMPEKKLEFKFLHIKSNGRPRGIVMSKLDNLVYRVTCRFETILSNQQMDGRRTGLSGETAFEFGRNSKQSVTLGKRTS